MYSRSGNQNAMPAEKRMTICNDKNIVFITCYLLVLFFPDSSESVIKM
jgi:hypothetical protein